MITYETEYDSKKLNLYCEFQFTLKFNKKFRYIMNQSYRQDRVEWVDFAKGICIILVVLMHSNNGVEKYLSITTAFQKFIHWAQPFRMPDFFLISGLFLNSAINKPWREYLDKKCFHFVYFYVLWFLIQHVFKTIAVGNKEQLFDVSYIAYNFIKPFGTLWFIYLLPLLFVVVKLTKFVPPLLIFIMAAMLEIAHIKTGSIVIDEFAARFVYFYVGYWLANTIFEFSDSVRGMNGVLVGSGIIIWGVFEMLMVSHGFSSWRGISLLLGFIGTGALIATSVLIAKTKYLIFLRYCGQYSLVIYLAFSLFMGTMRVFLIKFLPNLDPHIITLACLLSGVFGPLIIQKLTNRTKFDFLFSRPQWAKIKK
jgi:uncharacterized membrane protein YcfT